MFICMTKNMDGSHGVQMGGTQQPGWAYLPESVHIPDSFPFVDIEVKLITYPSTAHQIGFSRFEVVAIEPMESIVETPVSESNVAG